MIEKIREWLKRDLWSIGPIAMQEEIIDCHNIILALVDVVEASKLIPCTCGDLCFSWCVDLEDALTAADERIGEILGREL